MKKIFVILLWILLSPILSSGQGESNNWYFGYQAGLRFNADGSITQFADSALNAPEGSATVSDVNGNLLFYTDGQTIYDSAHEIMESGTGLTTNPTGTQTALIVPKPGDANIFYVFSVDATTNGVRGTGLNYAIVDMRLNDGYGAVVDKNINLLADCAEKITAVIKSCTEQSIWIVTQATETGERVALPAFPNFNTLHAFEVTSAGVSNTSVKSTFNVITVLDDRGYIKISPDKTTLASANMRDGLLLYDFDAASGIFSNQQRVHMSGFNYAPYGLEFSPNSRFLYVETSNNMNATDGHSSDLLQYDLLANDLLNSRLVLDTSDVYRGALQIASNGKIYRALSENWLTGIPYLGVINNPNELGLGTNYDHNGLALSSGESSVGLPPKVLSFFDRLDLLPNNEEDITLQKLNLCEGQSLILEVQNIPDATYLWEKDNIPFANPNRNIYNVDEPADLDEGHYQVTITRPNEEECPVVGEITVDIVEVPVANERLLILCDNDIDDSEDGLTTINLRDIEQNDGNTYAYFLSLEDESIAIENPEEFLNTEPFKQTIFYEVTSEAGCQATGELNVQIEIKTILVIDDVYLLCTDSSPQILMPPEGFDSYRWSKIENTNPSVVSNDKEFDVFEAGNYILEGINYFSYENKTIECISTANFQVVSSSTAIIDDIEINGNLVKVNVSGDGDYEFSLDGISFQVENTLQVFIAGEVNIFVRDKNGCGVAKETIEQDLTMGRFPNFFTPNGDGANDYWQYIPAIAAGDVDLDVIHIFSRYGSMLAQIDPNSQGWNGIFNGRPLPATDYWFKAKFSDNSVFIGNISLKR